MCWLGQTIVVNLSPRYFHENWILEFCKTVTNSSQKGHLLTEKYIHYTATMRILLKYLNAITWILSLFDPYNINPYWNSISFLYTKIWRVMAPQVTPKNRHWFWHRVDGWNGCEEYIYESVLIVVIAKSKFAFGKSAVLWWKFLSVIEMNCFCTFDWLSNSPICDFFHYHFNAWLFFRVFRSGFCWGILFNFKMFEMCFPATKNYAFSFFMVYIKCDS